MIERQFFRSELAPAILAGISVSGKNIDAGKLDGAVAVLQTDELEEPHHGRQLEGNRNTVDLAVINLEDFYFSLPQESDRFLPMNNAQGFIRGVEQEGHFHLETSFPTEAPCVRGPSPVWVRSESRNIVCHKLPLKSS